MDCNCEDESCIDIVKPMVTNLAHQINVVPTFINIKGLEQVVCMKGRKKRAQEFDECTILSMSITIAIVIQI